jgi:hypothetical protein
MIIVKIGAEEFSLPEGWHEVNLRTFQTVISLNERIEEWKSTVEFSIEVFTSLIGCPKENIMNLTRESFNTLVEETKWLYTEVPSNPKEEFELLGSKWRLLKDLNKLTMGETISLELKISESNATTILANIVPILLRRVKEVKVSDKIETSLMAFEADKYEQLREEVLDKINVTEIISFRDFFSNGVTASSGTTKVTSVKQGKKTKPRHLTS